MSQPPQQNQTGQSSGPQMIQPSQATRLLAVLKDEIEQAKRETNQEEARKHYARADQIKQVLVTYQRQQRAAAARAQAAQGGAGNTAGMANQSQPANPAANLPSGSQAQYRNPAQTPGMGQAATQQPQQQQNAQARPAGSIPNTQVTPEKYNQVRQRILDLERKITTLEAGKRPNMTAEQTAHIDNQLHEWRLKYSQFQRFANIMKNQLMLAQNQGAGASSSSPQVNRAATPGSAPAQGAAGSPPAPSTSASIPAQGAQNFQRNVNAAAPGAPGARPAPVQGASAGQVPQRPVGSTQSAPTNAAAVGAAGLGISAQSAPLQHPNPAAQPSGLAGATPGPAARLPGSAAPSVGAPGSSTPAPGTPGLKTGTNASAPGSQAGKGRSASPVSAGKDSGVPGVNLSGITKPSVPSIPILNSINVKPPNPITLKPGANTVRPTMSGGASGLGQVMGTPAIMRMPTYDMATTSAGISDNGGRVLTKRKLTELVNTIGADEGDGRTTIDGDVEELLLDLADEFVSSVTSFACRLAKHRKTDSVDVRDVQLHLERNWNIRVPGYAMDEIRAMRKWQPSSSYNQKVSSLEIAKAVNGNMN